MIRIACRQSELARIQANIVGEQLLEFFGEFQLVTCSTLADRKQDSTLANIGGKGLFVKEVEQALLDNKADIAVHSLKDMPVVQMAELPIAAVSARAPANDVLVGASSWQALPKESIVGTCSPRRSFQLKLLRPDVNIVPLRGNINTRIAKLEKNELAAVVLAQAGIERANKKIPYYAFSFDEMLPAAGQGVLATQISPNFVMPDLAIKKINDLKAFAEVSLEREIVAYLGANCHSPLAVFASVSDLIYIQVKAGNDSEFCYLESQGCIASQVLEEIKAKIDNSSIRKLISNC